MFYSGCSYVNASLRLTKKKFYLFFPYGLYCLQMTLTKKFQDVLRSTGAHLLLSRDSKQKRAMEINVWKQTKGAFDWEKQLGQVTKIIWIKTNQPRQIHRFGTINWKKSYNFRGFHFVRVFTLRLVTHC